MIIANLHGFICFTINLRCLNISLNFRSLWNGCLRERSLSFNPIRFVNMRVSTPIFGPMASPISCRVHTPINKIGLPSVSIATSWRWILPSSLMHPCHRNIGTTHSLSPHTLLTVPQPSFCPIARPCKSFLVPPVYTNFRVFGCACWPNYVPIILINFSYNLLDVSSSAIVTCTRG
jgi:hypothetical protein